jgi:hypothetical protein
MKNGAQPDARANGRSRPWLILNVGQNISAVSEMLPTIQYAVYAEISRRLTEAERRTIFEALDANVPSSGHVGHERMSAPDEVCFAVEASSEEIAKAQADAYMKLILQVATSDVQYAITMQRM